MSKIRVRDTRHEFLCVRVEEFAEPWAVRHVRPTFDGDAEAALSLSIALGNEKRGIVAVILWKARLPRPAFRAYLANVWGHDHSNLIAAAGTRRTLSAMFRYAEFALPNDLPERVRVWRGTSAMTLAQSRAGYSWTTNRDVACWFAMRFAEWNGRPLVLVADAALSDIALLHNDRDEHEAVLMRPQLGARIDGDEDDWRQRHALHSDEIRKHFAGIGLSYARA